MKIFYRPMVMGAKRKALLESINSIIEEYAKDGYKLSLRQLYYQLVTKNIVANKASEYSKLSVLVKEGRMAGIVDWEAIEDRTRGASVPGAWDDPAEILDSVIEQYRNDRQEGQSTYVEVWVEKDALSGVLKRVTQPLGVPIVVNKGYSSASAMHEAYKRFKEADTRGQNVIVLYLGDFDPSGLDMIRDIQRRIGEFVEGGEHGYLNFHIEPIALTETQIKYYNPPKNPAKMKDPRAPEYVAKHGRSSWEVDALPPRVLHSLLEEEIKSRMDMEVYDKIIENEESGKKQLKNLKKLL